ncbi:MAG: hypothetical protein ACTSU9_13930, partial [Promethearchaeota archaeon]
MTTKKEPSRQHIIVISLATILSSVILTGTAAIGYPARPDSKSGLGTMQTSTPENFGKIVFWNDADLLAFPNKTGTGTEADPFIIRDLYIRVTDDRGVGIKYCGVNDYYTQFINITVNATSVWNGILIA